MKLEIVERSYNPLFERDEIIAFVYSETTPSRKDVKTLIAAETGAKEEDIIVKKVETLTGLSKVKVVVFVYKNPDVLKVIEPDYMLKRNGVISDGQAQEQ